MGKIIGLMALTILLFRLLMVHAQHQPLRNRLAIEESETLKRIQDHLNEINKPSLLTIESPDGDIIDCIDKRRQLAFDHPLLKNHKIQEVPPEIPKRKKVETSGVSSGSTNEKWQMWHQNGTRCPPGTIPVWHTTVEDVLRAQSLYGFGKKHVPSEGIRAGHEYAVTHTRSLEELYGAEATINVWDPYVEDVINEFSLSQIWVVAEPPEGKGLNTIEAGWQVFPDLYGDSRPRLFIYWTRDSYQETGCYNLRCSGFVQTNSKVVIGGAISHVSSFGGKQYDITIRIWKDPKHGNWWLGYGENDDTLVGYWPAELFTHLANHATRVEWGGEIVNSKANGKHTSTQMGSGHFADEGFGRVSYFKNLKVVDFENNSKTVQDVQTWATYPNCYNIKMDSNSTWGRYFFYGGPGRNPKCLPNSSPIHQNVFKSLSLLCFFLWFWLV